ncbi:unnamed protein product [Closterium sp. Yama58-4]|nr:unnamed protein product [Closterium sp. Yama58-4]
MESRTVLSVTVVVVATPPGRITQFSAVRAASVRSRHALARTRFARTLTTSIVPDAPPITDGQLEQLHDFVADSRRLLVLTGAGVSTESGIPDYRSPGGAYSKGYKPMIHQDFVRSRSARRRYWARSFIGWRRFSAARPGMAHRALARLHERGRLAGGIITQNVDRLHHIAGSPALELHGTTHEVVCMQCGDISCRRTFQERIKVANPEWAAAVEHLEEGRPAGSDESFGMQRLQKRSGESRNAGLGSADVGVSERELMGMRRRPDGDIEISEEEWERHGEFVVPSCNACGGVLKPNVVLFGDNLPPARNQEAARMMSSADSLLVVGSSLMVLSAFRIASQCVQEGKPLALLAVGPNRADGIARIKIEARCGEVLSRLLASGSLDVPVGI